VISWSLYPPSDARGWILPWKKPYVSLFDWEGKQIGFLRSQLRKKELVTAYFAERQEEISTDHLIRVGNKLLLLPPEIAVFLKTSKLVETGYKKLSREEIREKTLKVIEEVERFTEEMKNIRKELMRLEGIILLEGKRDITKRKELAKRKDKLGIKYGLRRKQIEMLDNTIEEISPFLELYEPSPIKRKGRMYRFELGN
jgi:hypothetical protein